MQDSFIRDSVPDRPRLGPNRRMLNGSGVLICAAGLAFAYYAQFYMGLIPCPLCIFQRIALLVLGLVFLLATLHHPQDRGAKGYGILIGLVALIGTAIATRHVWLQHLPPEAAPSCGPGLDYMLETLSFSETLKEVLTGSGECAEVGWTLFGFSIPAWTLLLFISVGSAGAWGNWRLRY